MGPVALPVLCRRTGSLVGRLSVAFVLLPGDSFSEGVALRHSQLIPDYFPVCFAHLQRLSPTYPHSAVDLDPVRWKFCLLYSIVIRVVPFEYEGLLRFLGWGLVAHHPLKVFA